MKSKLIPLFLAMSVVASAAPTEKDALQAFTKMLNAGDFSSETLRSYPPGTMRYWVERVSYGTTYTETYEEEQWTVFVVNAVVAVGPVRSQTFRFSIKAGVALIQKGDEIMMREAFDHELSAAPPPTAEEIQKAKEEAERSQADAAEAQKSKEATANQKAIREQVEAKVAASIKPRESALSDSMTVHASVDNSLNINIWFDGRSRLQFGTRANGIVEISSGLNKWKEWSAKAKKNNVTSVEKQITSVPGGLGPKLLFEVDGAGVTSLTFSGELTGSINLSEQETGALSDFINTLSQDLVAATKAIDDETAKLSSESEKKDDLFK